MQLKEKDGGDGIKMPLDALLHADERTRDALPIGSLRNGLNQRSRPSSMTGFKEKMTQKNTDKSKIVSLNNQLAKIANELGKIEGCHEDAKEIWGAVFKLSTTINSIVEEAIDEDDDEDDFVNYGDIPE